MIVQKLTGGKTLFRPHSSVLFRPSVHTDQRRVGVNVRGKGVFSSRRNTNTNAQATKGRTKSHFSNGKELNSVTKKKEDPSYLHGLAKELIAAHSKEISVLLPQVVCHLQSHDGP